MDTKILNENVKKIYVLFSVVEGNLSIRAVSIDKSSLEFQIVALSRKPDSRLFDLHEHYFIEEYENFIFNPQN